MRRPNAGEAGQVPGGTIFGGRPVNQWHPLMSFFEGTQMVVFLLSLYCTTLILLNPFYSSSLFARAYPRKSLGCGTSIRISSVIGEFERLEHPRQGQDLGMLVKDVFNMLFSAIQHSQCLKQNKEKLQVVNKLKYIS